ncbi:LysR family transcriptional regulator substrate-binding protein [Salinibacterium sp. M195]|uniref:LysR family transcriptional regulator substrate-binding protein n=1 Tax=Salinibacterium sp. M195 TaxID=2583374 RepID=UPI001C62ED13|nr:LysR family transcriptional regulator substrate-binding protein [Salinibacterium sp. M195]QYH36211.1 LysR family transcriptional regulator substrate-binding protein [Salinibacterium sp. M195]
MPSSFTAAFVLGATPGKWARVWNERLADVPLDLVSSEQADALAMLRSGAADVALVRLPIDLDFDGDRPLAAIPLYTERAVVVVPKDHPLAKSDVVRLMELNDENVVTDEWREATELVAANVGVAVMPQSVARALMRRDVVAKMLDDGPQWQVAIAWRDGSVDPHVEEFIGIVRGRTARSSRGMASGSESDELVAEAGASKVAPKKQQQQNQSKTRIKYPRANSRRPTRPGKRQPKKR